MPRLTNQTYLANSLWLRKIWNGNLKSLFAVLSVQRQIDLHAYFAPTKDLTDEERVEHRRAISEEFTDLPARAGRYFASMRDVYDKAVDVCRGNDQLIKPYISSVVAPLKTDKSGRKIGIAAIARPEPALRGFARALVQLAQDNVGEQKPDAA